METFFKKPNPPVQATAILQKTRASEGVLSFIARKLAFPMLLLVGLVSFVVFFSLY